MTESKEVRRKNGPEGVGVDTTGTSGTRSRTLEVSTMSTSSSDPFDEDRGPSERP